MWVPALGLADLTTSWFLEKATIVHDVGYGAITGLLVPAGLLAQLRRPDTAIAGLQQVGMCAVAYAVAGVVADRGYLVLAALVAAGLVLLLLVHPTGGTVFALPDESSPLLAGLALLAAGPLAVYAVRTAERERAGAAPVDAHVHLGSWGGLTAMAVGIVLVALVAALRTKGWRVPAYSAAAAAAVWGLGNALYPNELGSEGRGWGLLALAWSATFALAAAYSGRPSAQPG